jgi:enoyl-CoA hydratase/carnithine racemase
MAEFVNVSHDSGVATIRLERPPMNALNAQVQREIADAAQSVAEDTSVGAVVVYGGPKVRCDHLSRQLLVSLSPRSLRLPVTRSVGDWNWQCAVTFG